MRSYFKSGSKFPDLSGDGKVTQKDILIGKGVIDRSEAKKGGSMKSKYHKTKSGKMARKGLWYNIMMKRKRGAKMRKKGEKGAPTAAAIKKSQGK